MRKKAFDRKLRYGAVVTAAIFSLFAPSAGFAQSADGRGKNTTTPIKHVIIIGENRTFDNVFATYAPKARETVWNLLSEGIVKSDGTPGPNYSKALQYSASDYDRYQLAPPKTRYQTLPPFQVGGPSTPYGCQLIGITTGTDCNTPANVAKVMPYENGLPPDYYQYLLTGGTGQTSSGNTTGTLVPDARVYYDGENASNLPPGPFQITQSTHTPTMP